MTHTDRRRGTFIAVAGACVAVAGLLPLWRDVLYRRTVDQFVAESGLAVRRPLDAASLAFEPDADLAGSAAVLSAILDPSNVRAVEPAAGAAWLPAARRLALAGLRERPGWPLHAHVLAEVAYREWRSRGASPDPRRWDPRRWMRAWKTAADGAPAVALFRDRWAAACLESWPSIPQNLRGDALAAIRAAFLDPDFVARGMGRAAELVGVEGAIALLPGKADSIRAAAAAIAERDLDAAKRLLDRADSAERAERSAALRRIEDLARSRRAGDLSDACRAFAAAYPAERFDDAAGRSETSRLMALWPREPGAWESDARAPLVRFLLERGGPVGTDSSASLLRAVAPLSGVPIPVAASLLDSANDHTTAEKLRNSGAVSSAADWAGYDVSSARRALSRGDVSAARRALERLSPDARENCDALLVRRDFANRAGDAAGSAEIERRLSEQRSDPALRERWRSTGRLAMCIDESAATGRSLVLPLDAEKAIVAYGWDGTRTGTILLSGPRVLVLPLEGRDGARELWITGLAGGPVMRADFQFQ